MKDLYSILGVVPDCEPEAIKAAYRALVLQHHPDQFQKLSTVDQEQAHERFLEIKEAYEVLSDSAQREEYDLDFVTAFPGYELEGEEEEEEYWEENPPARMPVEHGDTSNGMLRLLLLLILPVVTTTLMAFISSSVWLILAAAVGGLVMAIWLGGVLRDGG